MLGVDLQVLLRQRRLLAAVLLLHLVVHRHTETERGVSKKGTGRLVGHMCITIDIKRRCVCVFVRTMRIIRRSAPDSWSVTMAGESYSRDVTRTSCSLSHTNNTNKETEGGHLGGLKETGTL